jgi:hypothetical protein
MVSNGIYFVDLPVVVSPLGYHARGQIQLSFDRTTYMGAAGKTEKPETG